MASIKTTCVEGLDNNIKKRKSKSSSYPSLTLLNKNENKPILSFDSII
jgi:hypothetical protein